MNSTNLNLIRASRVPGRLWCIILYDENDLYIGIYAYDREPEAIVATNKSRDGNLGVDDTIRIYLDPLNTRRDSYYFEMNVLGARQDALIQNNNDFIREWKSIWTGRAMRTANGFSVEIAIPFRDLAFDPEKPDWVLEMGRNIRRKGERIRRRMITWPMAGRSASSAEESCPMNLPASGLAPLRLSQTARVSTKGAKCSQLHA